MPSPPLRGRGHNNPMKLKSRLRVTPGHWKRNQCIDHTRLTISRVIWRWILALPWNVGQRSLKVIENCTVWKIGYGFLFAFHSNYSRIAVSLAVSEIFGVKEWPDLKIWVWGRSKSLKMARFDHVWHSIGPPLYHVRVIWRWIISRPWNLA